MDQLEREREIQASSAVAREPGQASVSASAENVPCAGSALIDIPIGASNRLSLAVHTDEELPISGAVVKTDTNETRSDALGHASIQLEGQATIVVRADGHAQVALRLDGPGFRIVHLPVLTPSSVFHGSVEGPRQEAADETDLNVGFSKS